MLGFGNYGDDNPPLDLRDDYSPARTSSSDFFRALQDFLSRNQMNFVGPFRMRLEGISNNNWRLLVEGETSKSDCNAPIQVGVGLSSSVIGPTYSWIPMFQYSQDPGFFP